MKKIKDIKQKIKDTKDEERESFSDDFYEEVDSKKRKSSALWIVLLSLFLVFALLVYGLISLKRYVGTSFDFLNKKQEIVDEEAVGLVNAFEEDLSLAEVGATVQVKISEGELKSALAIDSALFPLRNAELDITTESINISGKTATGILSVPVTVRAVPVIENKKFKVNIVSIDSGSVSLPKMIRDEINTYLDDYINKKMSQINNFEFSDASLTETDVLISGTKLKV